MTLAEWGALDEDVEGELVDGVLEEEETPSFRHELVVAWLIATLRAWARPRGGFVCGSETKLAVGLRRGRKPDLAVFVRGATPSPDATVIRVPPHLVVEVASPRPRDVRRDRVDKLTDYARAGIRVYCIVDPQLRSAEVFELGDDRRYAVAATAASGRLRVVGCPGLQLDLDVLWAEIDAAERAHRRSDRAAPGNGRRGTARPRSARNPRR
jgi:Uma2 family endonuclease